MSKLLLLALVGLAGSVAEARPDSRAMSCAQARNMVNRYGAVVMSYGPDIYERFVAHQGYCNRASSEFAEPAWIPARDTAQCFVGYRCVERRDWVR